MAEEKRNGKTEIVFILDMSGSMHALREDTLGGFNSMLAEEKRKDGECIVSTVLFNDVSTVIHDRVPIEDVGELTDREYVPMGCTALLDAVGGAIHHIGNVHKYAREEDRPDRTLFVITTDGMENASRMYDYSHVKHQIERQKSRFGWEFIFFGANIDAAREAGRFGIGRECAVDYRSDSAGTRLNYRAMAMAVDAVRKGDALEGSAWRDEIDRDFSSRKK